MPNGKKLLKTSLRQQARELVKNKPELKKGHLFRGISLEGNPYYQGDNITPQLIFDCRLLEQIQTQGDQANKLFVVLGDTLHIHNIALEEGIAINEVDKNLDKLTKLAKQKLNTWWQHNKKFILDALKNCYRSKFDSNQLNELSHIGKSQEPAEQQISALNALLANSKINIAFFSWQNWLEHVKKVADIKEIEKIDARHKELLEKDAKYKDAFNKTAAEFVKRHNKLNDQSGKSEVISYDRALAASLNYLCLEAHVLLKYTELEPVNCKTVLYAGPISVALEATRKQLNSSVSWTNTADLKTAKQNTDYKDECANFKFNIIRISQQFNLTQSQDRQLFIQLLSLLLIISMDEHYGENSPQAITDLLSALQDSAQPVDKLQQSSQVFFSPTIAVNTAGNMLRKLNEHTPQTGLQPSITTTICHAKRLEVLIHYIKGSMLTHMGKAKLNDDEKTKFTEKFARLILHIFGEKAAPNVIAAVLKETLSNIIVIQNNVKHLEAFSDELLAKNLKTVSTAQKSTIQKMLIDGFGKYVAVNTSDRENFVSNLVNDLIFEIYVGNEDKEKCLQKIADYAVPTLENQLGFKQQVAGSLKNFILASGDDKKSDSIIQDLSNKVYNKFKKHIKVTKEELNHFIRDIFIPFTLNELDNKKSKLTTLIQNNFTKLSSIPPNKLHEQEQTLQKYLAELSTELISPWHQIGLTIEAVNKYFDKTQDIHFNILIDIILTALLTGLANALRKPEKIKECVGLLIKILSPVDQDLPSNSSTGKMEAPTSKQQTGDSTIVNGEDIINLLNHASILSNNDLDSQTNLINLKRLRGDLSFAISKLILRQNRAMQTQELAWALQEACYIIYPDAADKQECFLKSLLCKLKSFVNDGAFKLDSTIIEAAKEKTEKGKVSVNPAIVTAALFNLRPVLNQFDDTSCSLTKAPSLGS